MGHKSKTPAAAAPSAPQDRKKRKRDGSSKSIATKAASIVETSAPAIVSAKKQRIDAVSSVAKDVMMQLLAGDLNYTVSDDEWEALVQLTQSHMKFQKHFDFPSATEPGWVKPKKTKKDTHLQIVALDCEMCVTAPLSNAVERKSNALCRVSVVNGQDMIRGIVSDLIVHQPEEGYKMIDPKTDIHGVTMAMIDQSKISVAKAQKYLLKYINADTIVVGHSVHGDLASLRIDHKRVIDTAKIFQRKESDPARATPGLKCLTKFLLKFEMPDGHDSTIDAQASMLSAKYAAKHERGAIIPSMLELHGPRADTRKEPAYTGPPKIIPSAFQLHLTGTTDTGVSTSSTRVPMSRPPPAEVLQALSCQLRVHRIPRGFSAKHLKDFFIQVTKVVPSAIETVVWPEKKPHGSTTVTFTSNLHAQAAFESTPHDKSELDSIGRPQKMITITTRKGQKYTGIKVGVK